MNLTFHTRIVNGEKWCCLSSMGIKRLDIVAYKMDKTEQHTFAGGHRHRYLVAREDIHLKFPTNVGETKLDISAVPPTVAPKKKQRHDKR